MNQGKMKRRKLNGVESGNDKLKELIMYKKSLVDSLGYLPADIIQYILKYIDKETFLAIASISKKYRTLVTKNYGFEINGWVSIYITKSEIDDEVPWFPESPNYDSDVPMDPDESLDSDLVQKTNSNQSPWFTMYKGWKCLKKVRFIVSNIEFEDFEFYKKNVEEVFKDCPIKNMEVKLTVPTREFSYAGMFRKILVDTIKPDELRGINDPMLWIDMKHSMIKGVVLGCNSETKKHQIGNLLKIISKKQKNVDNIAVHNITESSFDLTVQNLKHFNELAKVKLYGSFKDAPIQANLRIFSKTLKKLTLLNLEFDAANIPQNIESLCLLHCILRSYDNLSRDRLKKIRLKNCSVKLKMFNTLINGKRIENVIISNKSKFISKEGGYIKTKRVLRKLVLTDEFDQGGDDMMFKLKTRKYVVCSGWVCRRVSGVSVLESMEIYTREISPVEFMKNTFYYGYPVNVKIACCDLKTEFMDFFCNMLEDSPKTMFQLERDLLGFRGTIPKNIIFKNNFNLKNIVWKKDDFIIKSPILSWPIEEHIIKQTSKIYKMCLKNIWLNKLHLFETSAESLKITFLNVSELTMFACSIKSITVKYSDLKMKIQETDIKKINVLNGSFVTLIIFGYNSKVPDDKGNDGVTIFHIDKAPKKYMNETNPFKLKNKTK